ncbi:rop guanine nucleotide exchange factor 14-like isoform X3 [Dioscorea cayenensis subsp. rotundata]|uniref:Rop guanine nucleotide exchange factor 14-like isoform X3 n=1 Tax=Dioscorea cayennensis subsp. rotundata TaxID=55577 RepID=A0AB40CNT5_DIOCR|nr:rop guanine nucleotide exchange factor 14-like isoform X3 [Dioscorea cayenensis subsp. rotundata]
MMRRLACCRRHNRDISIDFDENNRVVTYNGLESFILNSCSHDNISGNSGMMSGPDGCVTTTDLLDEDSTSCSSSKDASGSSFSSQCLASNKKEKEEEEQPLHDLDILSCLDRVCPKGKAQPTAYLLCISDVEVMKEKFAKLLLGEDVSGGTRGISTALALSNAIINLSACVFGELWKLEPLSEERKKRWRREMDWLLSPINYMVELVPAKQNGVNGRMLEVEVMTSKARSDVHVSLPALQKLDTMLIDVLDSMVDTEFWYSEGGSRAEGWSSTPDSRPSKRWWLPSPRVPESGLSTSQRKRLGCQGKLVHQVLKAAKSINEQVLLQMPIPTAVKDALPKSGKSSLGKGLYHAITAEFCSIEEIMLSLNLKSEHCVLETVNRLEGAIFAWRHRISEQPPLPCKKSPIRYPWHLIRDARSQAQRMEAALERAETILCILKMRFPNLPQTFIDVTKVQDNKDVGHSIVEAYSRVLVSIAFRILSRIGDILQEDEVKKPSTPIATLRFDFSSDVYLAGITETPPGHIRRSLIDQMNIVDGRICNSIAVKTPKDLHLFTVISQ